MYKSVCDIVGAGYPTPPLGLLTVAALLPSNWEVRLIDRNFQTIEAADLEWADVIMTGGMMTQQNDTLAIIRLAQASGKPVVVGGPDVTSSVDVYESADFKVLGEAEGVIEDFIEAWGAGERTGAFDAATKQVDLTRSPLPRFDLIKGENYLQAAVQFSRGCPFTCEFCDVIELFGRNPRTKTPEQITAELDAIYKLGYRGGLFFVDDNLMGHRKALRALLPVLADWQARHGYPFDLSTQITINLADDPALMEMMRNANFAGVFIGIESIDEPTLIASRKKQNAHREIIECLDRIRHAGMFVQAGMIVGFDTETGSVASTTIQFVDDAAITWAAVSLMHALPHTQLTRRLEREGRLYPGSHIQPTFDESTPFGVGMGLNFETKRPRRDIIADYVAILENIYAPAAYFSRLSREAKAVRRPPFKRRITLKMQYRELRAFAKFAWRMTITHPHLRHLYWQTIFDCLRHNPSAIRAVIIFGGIYLDVEQSFSHVTATMKRQLEAIDRHEWVPYSRSIDGVAAPLAAAN
jgi:radical SAM superfamily enzyme YgiQ (UPF0313 family)